MENLLKDTQTRIEELGNSIEDGQQVANELEYRRRLQVITNDTMIDEKNRLHELLDEQNQPQLEKTSKY
jgi:hypothetical protein